MAYITFKKANSYKKETLKATSGSQESSPKRKSEASNEQNGCLHPETRIWFSMFILVIRLALRQRSLCQSCSILPGVSKENETKGS